MRMSINGWQRLYIFLFALTGIPLLLLWMLNRPESPYSEYVFSCEPIYERTDLKDVESYFGSNQKLTQEQARQIHKRIWGDKNTEIKVTPKIIEKINDESVPSQDGKIKTFYRIVDSEGVQFRVGFTHLSGVKEATLEEVRKIAQHYINVRYKQDNGEDKDNSSIASESASLPESEIKASVNLSYISADDAPWLKDWAEPFSEKCKSDLLRIASGEAEDLAYKKWLSALKDGFIAFMAIFLVIYAIGFGVSWVISGFRSRE